MTDTQNIARDVQAALPNADQTQIFHALGASIIVTDKQIFEIYESGTDVFVQVADRGSFEAVGDDTMWWATIPGESNPHFTDEALEAYRIGDEAEYQPHKLTDEQIARRAAGVADSEPLSPFNGAYDAALKAIQMVRAQA